MTAPDMTPGPGARDSVLRRGRTLRRRRHAAWASAGAALTLVGVLAGSALVTPDARRGSDLVSPVETTSPASAVTPSPEPAPTAESSPSATPTRPAPDRSTYALSSLTSAPAPWFGPDDGEPEVYRDEYDDDHGTLRAYPASYGTCSYRQQESDPSWIPGLKVSAGRPRLVDRTLYVTVTATNTGDTTLELVEQTLVPMDALFQGTRQVTGTGTFSRDKEIRYALAAGQSYSVEHRLHAVGCDSATSRSSERLPAGSYTLRAAVVVYPGEGGEGGPVYAPPVGVTLP